MLPHMLSQVILQSNVLLSRPNLAPREHCPHGWGLCKRDYHWGQARQARELSATMEPGGRPQPSYPTAARTPNPGGSSADPTAARTPGPGGSSADPTSSPFSTSPLRVIHPTPRCTHAIPRPPARHEPLTPLHSNHIMQNSNRLDHSDQLGNR